MCRTADGFQKTKIVRSRKLEGRKGSRLIEDHCHIDLDKATLEAQNSTGKRYGRIGRALDTVGLLWIDHT